MPRKGEKMSEAGRLKIAATKRGVWHKLVCSCGCGTEFELPDHRVRANKTGMFFLNLRHKVVVWKGEIHPNFRGGPVRYPRDWDKIATTIRERDVVCRQCGKTEQENGRALDVHHVVPLRVSNDNSSDNLIALCASCHQEQGIAEMTAYAPPPNQQRTCIVCGTSFMPSYPNRSMCSATCQRDRRRQRDRGYKKRETQQRTDAYWRKRACVKAWGDKNRERANEARRARYEATKEARRAYQRAWHARRKATDSSPSSPDLASAAVVGQP